MTAAFTCVLRDLGSLGSLIWRLSANRFVRHNTAQPAQHSSTGPELMTPVPPTPPFLATGFPPPKMQWAPPSYAGGASPKTNKHVTVCQGQLEPRRGGWHLSLVTRLLTGQALDLPWKQQRLTQLHARPPPLSKTADSSLPILQPYFDPHLLLLSMQKH